MEKRGQISIEYLAVLGFALIMVTALAVTFYMQYDNMKDQVNMKQAQQIVRKVVDSANSIYYLGEHSKTIVTVNMPSAIEEINISNNEFVIKVRTSGGLNDIYAVSNVNITGTISTSSGIKRIQLEALENSVNISEIQ